jgi:hypothetical protein
MKRAAPEQSSPVKSPEPDTPSRLIDLAYEGHDVRDRALRLNVPGLMEQIDRAEALALLDKQRRQTT